MAQDYSINLKVKGLGAAANQLGQFTGNLNEAAEEGKAATGVLDQMTGGAISGFKAAAGGIKTFIKGLGAVRIAVMATGIGALLIAITSLVTLFTKTQRGAERMERASAMLNAVFGELVDVAAQIGDFLYDAFTRPGEALQNFGNYIMDVLTVAVNPLRKSFLKLNEVLLKGGILMTEFLGNDASAQKQQLEENTQAMIELEQQYNESLTGVVAPFVAVTEAVSTFTSNVRESVKAADNLAQRSIALRQAQRDLRVEMATARKDIKAYNLIAEDTTKGFEERMEAADKAIALEQQLMADRKALAKEELKIHQQNMKLSESMEDDLERESELKAAVAALEMESLELQTTLNNKRNTINQQRIAQEEKLTAFQKEMARERMKEYAKAEAGIQDQLDQRIRDIDKLIIAEEEKESLRVQARASADAQLEKLQKDHQDKVKALSDQFAMEQMGGRQQQEAAIQQELEQRYLAIDQLAATEEEREQLRVEARAAANAKMLKLQKDFHQQDMEIVAAGAQATFDILKTLTDISEKDTEESAKKAFKRNKAISIAETLVNTYMAAQKAYASQIIPGDPTSIVRAQIAAGIAVATGLTKVAAIKATKFNSQSAAGSAGGSAGGGGGASPTRVGVDVGSLIPNQDTPTPEPVRAYVVENEISNKQALNRELQIQTTL